MPNPPPMFGPRDVFNTQEMQQAQQEMQQNFQKADGLRTDFAKKLAAGPVSKEEVLKHFNDVDSIMDSVKLKVQQKTAEKISSMSDEERKSFAERLSQHGGPPQGMQPGMQPGQGQMMPGQMPMGMPGQMPGMPGGPPPGMQPGQGQMMPGQIPGQGFGPGQGPGHSGDPSQGQPPPGQ
jgi:hypothetical protein